MSMERDGPTGRTDSQNGAEHALKGGGSNYAAAGLLMTYAPNDLALDRGAALYVDKALKAAQLG